MNTNVLRKSLVVAVILLFIGVAIAPSINSNVVKASNDNDLVEVTTQACGIKGYGNTTVKLTREQYQNLERYLVDFRARLNQTSTRGEAVPIFKEAVVELDKYGLLPKGMSVERAQKLLNSGYQNKRILSLLKQNFLIGYISTNKIQNIFCLIMAHVFSIPSYFFNLLYLLISLTAISIIIFTWNHNLPFPYQLMETLINIAEYSFYKPFYLISFMSNLGKTSFFTIGLCGIRSNTTSLNMIFGFTGLHITLDHNTYESYYIGEALLVE